MSTVDSSTSSIHIREDRTASRKSWLGVITVALGIFSIVTAEQLPVGLLTSMSSDLRVSQGTAGLMVTAPGLVAAIAAPLVPVTVGRLDRRWLLAGLMALMVAAHLLSTTAPNFAVLLVSRVLVGISIGGFWAIAGGLAIRLVPHTAVPRATSLIFGGVAAANVLGVPAGTLIGELTDWRIAFAALGGLGALVLGGLLVLLPSLPATQPVRVRELVAQWSNVGVRAGVIATFLLVTGHFAAYTFVSPVLQDIAGIGPGLISSLLLGYGVAGIIGNFITGSAAARHLRPTMLLITIALSAVLMGFPLVGAAPLGGFVLLILWGLAFGGVSVSLQTWILQAAPRATEAATALWVSAFNLSIALGALVGGRVVDAVSLPGVLWLGGVLVILTVLAVRSTPKGQPT